MKRRFFSKKIVGSLLAAGVVSGCATPLAVVDGRLDDSAWGKLPVYSLVPPQDRITDGKILREKGTCRFFSAQRTLYLVAKFDDSCLAPFGEKDGDDLYHGDCCEIFIKPVGQPFYWEIWISPDGFRSVVKWRKKDDLESKGRLIDGREIRATVTVKDAQYSNRHGWILNAAIPLPEVSGIGLEEWDILIARQNYDETLSKQTRELSSFPQLQKSNFHRTEEYFRLK